MPGLDGYQTTKQIRNLMHQNLAVQTIIVSVSGSTEKKYQQMAYKSGMNYCLFKPVGYQELDQLVSTLKFPMRMSQLDLDPPIYEEEIDPEYLDD